MQISATLVKGKARIQFGTSSTVKLICDLNSIFFLMKGMALDRLHIVSIEPSTRSSLSFKFTRKMVRNSQFDWRTRSNNLFFRMVHSTEGRRIK